MPKGLVTKTAGKHFEALLEYNKSRKFPDEQVFVEDSTYPRQKLKKRIIEGSMIPYVCNDCGLTDEWNGKKIVLQIGRAHV